MGGMLGAAGKCVVGGENSLAVGVGMCISNLVRKGLRSYSVHVHVFPHTHTHTHTGHCPSLGLQAEATSSLEHPTKGPNL